MNSVTNRQVTDYVPRETSASDNISRVQEALKSGRYRQGHCVYRDGRGGFCLMAIVADVMDPHAWFYLTDQSEIDMREWPMERNGHWCHPALLPKWDERGKPFLPAARWIGIDETTMRELTEQNDNGVTLPELADRLEPYKG